jgi:hypothetical protein
VDEYPALVIYIKNDIDTFGWKCPKNMTPGTTDPFDYNKCSYMKRDRKIPNMAVKSQNALWSLFFFALQVYVTICKQPQNPTP